MIAGSRAGDVCANCQTNPTWCGVRPTLPAERSRGLVRHAPVVAVAARASLPMLCTSCPCAVLCAQTALQQGAREAAVRLRGQFREGGGWYRARTCDLLPDCSGPTAGASAPPSTVVKGQPRPCSSGAEETRAYPGRTCLGSPPGYVATETLYSRRQARLVAGPPGRQKSSATSPARRIPTPQGSTFPGSRFGTP
jgi:hypothetical protein